MDASLNVATLLVKGTLVWTDATAKNHLYLCAGFVWVPVNGAIKVNVALYDAVIYIKDNGVIEPDSLSYRVFGGQGK